MPTWLLILVGLCIPRYTITIDGFSYDIGSILRLIIFIFCCIWG